MATHRRAALVVSVSLIAAACTGSRPALEHATTRTSKASSAPTTNPVADGGEAPAPVRQHLTGDGSGSGAVAPPPVTDLSPSGARTALDVYLRALTSADSGVAASTTSVDGPALLAVALEAMWRVASASGGRVKRVAVPSITERARSPLRVTFDGQVALIQTTASEGREPIKSATALSDFVVERREGAWVVSELHYDESPVTSRSSHATATVASVALEMLGVVTLGGVAVVLVAVHSRGAESIEVAEDRLETADRPVGHISAALAPGVPDLLYLTYPLVVPTRWAATVTTTTGGAKETGSVSLSI